MTTKNKVKGNQNLLNCDNCGNKQTITNLVNSLKKSIEKMKRNRFTLYSDVVFMEKIVGFLKQKQVNKVTRMMRDLETDVREFLSNDTYYTLYEVECSKCHTILPK